MSNEENDDVVTSADSGPESVRLHVLRAQLFALELELRSVKDAHAQLLEQAHRFNEVVIGNEAMRTRILEEDVESIEHRRANRSTLRDYFAAGALNGLLAGGIIGDGELNERAAARDAYAIADAMLAARKEGAE